MGDIIIRSIFFSILILFCAESVLASMTMEQINKNNQGVSQDHSIKQIDTENINSNELKKARGKAPRKEEGSQAKDKAACMSAMGHKDKQCRSIKYPNVEAIKGSSRVLETAYQCQEKFNKAYSKVEGQLGRCEDSMKSCAQICNKASMNHNCFSWKGKVGRIREKNKTIKKDASICGSIAKSVCNGDGCDPTTDKTFTGKVKAQGTDLDKKGLQKPYDPTTEESADEYMGGQYTGEKFRAQEESLEQSPTAIKAEQQQFNSNCLYADSLDGCNWNGDGSMTLTDVDGAPVPPTSVKTIAYRPTEEGAQKIQDIMSSSTTFSNGSSSGDIDWDNIEYYDNKKEDTIDTGDILDKMNEGEELSLEPPGKYTPQKKEPRFRPIAKTTKDPPPTVTKVKKSEDPVTPRTGGGQDPQEGRGGGQQPQQQQQKQQAGGGNNGFGGGGGLNNGGSLNNAAALANNNSLNSGNNGFGEFTSGNSKKSNYKASNIKITPPKNRRVSASDKANSGAEEGEPSEDGKGAGRKIASLSPQSARGYAGRFSGGRSGAGKKKKAEKEEYDESAAEAALRKQKGNGGFFGALGKAGNAVKKFFDRGFTKERSWDKKNKNKGYKKASDLAGPNALLAKYRDRMRGGRGLASTTPPGFTDRNTFIFSSMCLSYFGYQKENEISNGQTWCPKNRP